MHQVHLVIPDGALREAVSEQLKLAGLGMKEHAVLSAALADNAVILADEAALDKKALAALREKDGENLSLLLLGSAGGKADELPIAESFAKPLRLGHLLARLKFHLETAPRLRKNPVAFGPFRLEPRKRCLTTVESGAEIRLTEKETALLEYLGQSGASVSREELLAAIWGYDAGIDTHTLETHIYQLRRKLDPAGERNGFLVNEQGSYRLVS